MLTKSQKQKIVEDLTDKFKRTKIAIFSDFRGISVAKSQNLRRLLKKIEAEYRVAKKTLLDRVLEKLGLNLKTKSMEGEISVTFGYGDEINSAKTLFKFGKENETFKILGGILGERILNAQEVIALAKLPPREVLLSKLVSVLSSPIQGLVTVLGENIRNLVVIINKIKEVEARKTQMATQK
ncbi:MAG: 50S ribosomal protein L10 [Candidatus Sungiibacteriota bacterium]|uniref:Large ribosomal subunit protein uL10 n=1 Tax=Candidatus Sungiibacteriota bacterium TaxID=2750080 RepID=A0A7T5UQX6_9BACT|nr:MAG: 50S ribosomal protein L10 [Candidatus Sungbacteria bacterium]